MNYFFILIGIVFILYVLNIIKKGEFPIQESIFWMFGAVIVLILAIFPKLIDTIASFLQIAYGPSLLFLISTIFLFFLVFRNTKKITKQNQKIIELAQRCSLLEFELEQIKQEKKSSGSKE